MIIRDEELHDRAAIHDVVRAAFGQTAEAVLVDQLRDDGDSVISLVAVDDDAWIIGHVMLSRMEAPFKALGLAPVSVRPDRQRSGVGSSPVREALTRVGQGSWDAVFVLGNPGFYRRFGFDLERASGFTSPYAGPHFMVLPMKNGLPATTGRIDYASAFAALE
jgi:putative acetyltransferase